jgi:hypothetical protein
MSFEARKARSPSLSSHGGLRGLGLPEISITSSNRPLFAQLNASPVCVHASTRPCVSMSPCLHVSVCPCTCGRPLPHVQCLHFLPILLPDIDLQAFNLQCMDVHLLIYPANSDHFQSFYNFTSVTWRLSSRPRGYCSNISNASLIPIVKDFYNYYVKKRARLSLEFLFSSRSPSTSASPLDSQLITPT